MLTAICNSNARESHALFWPPWALLAHGVQTFKHILIHIKSILKAVDYKVKWAKASARRAGTVTFPAHSRSYV